MDYGDDGSKGAQQRCLRRWGLGSCIARLHRVAIRFGGWRRLAAIWCVVKLVMLVVVLATTWLHSNSSSSSSSSSGSRVRVAPSTLEPVPSRDAPPTTPAPGAWLRRDATKGRQFFQLSREEQQALLAKWAAQRRKDREQRAELRDDTASDDADVATGAATPAPSVRAHASVDDAAASDADNGGAPNDTPAETEAPQRRRRRQRRNSVPPFDDQSHTFTSHSERRRYRRGVIIDELEHSFAGYARCAWGYDEAQPVSCQGRNWNDMDGYQGPGLGLTIVDSLSTLWLANLTTQWDKALEYVRDELSFDVDYSASTFELTIRMIGGLISAYEVSGEVHKFLLDKATDIARRLQHAYDTPSGIPDSHVHLKLLNHTHAPWHKGAALLAEFGTNMLELRAMSYHSGDVRYAKAANRINGFVSNVCSQLGLCFTRLNTVDTQWAGDEVTLGGLGDSYYEYLLKGWVHSGFQDTPTLARFLRVAASVFDTLLVQETEAQAAAAKAPMVPVVDEAALARQHRTRRLRGERARPDAPLPTRPQQVRRAFVTQMRGGETVRVMDHLTCFAAGMFELGYHLAPWQDADYYDSLRQQQGLPQDLQAQVRAMSLGLGETCRRMANMTHLGLSPEVVELASGGFDAKAQEGGAGLHVFHLEQPYLLRPEAFESFYYLALFDLHPRAAGRLRNATEGRHLNPKAGERESVWERYAWDAFLAIRRHCKVPFGYSGVRNVRQGACAAGDAAAGRTSRVSSTANGQSDLLIAEDCSDEPDHTDVMETFWFAETLKYLLLTFSLDPASFDAASPVDEAIARINRRRRQRQFDEGGVTTPPTNKAHDEATALDVATGVTSKWVLNTEAHPLRIRPDLFDRVPML